MFIIAMTGQCFFFSVCKHRKNRPEKNALMLMPAPLLNLKVAAITGISNPSSKNEFVGLFGFCSFCVPVILSGIQRQKALMLLLFLIYNVCLLGIVSIL